MKILLLSGASTIHTLRWANGLAAAGHGVVCASQHEFLDEHWDPRVRKVRLPHSPSLGYFVNGERVTRLFAEEGCELLNAHYASGYGLLALRSGVRPCLLSVWGSDVYDFPRQSPLHRWLLRRSLRAATGIASTSEAMARQVESLLSGSLTRPIAITPFGVDTERFAPAARAPTSGPLVIGTVKKLESKYGIDTLIKAFARLPAGPVLRLVGDGPQRAELQVLAASLGVAERVQWSGAVPHEQVPAALQGMDIFVAASRLDSESFGVAVIEASACGLPVVVTRVGGLPEVVIEGETGLIVPREDDAALATALQALVDAPALRLRLGQAGRRLVQSRYEWSHCVQRMVAVYEELQST